MSDAYLRLLGTAFRRYAADPSTREASARQMLGAAIAIYAADLGPSEAALTASEYLAALAQERRLKGRFETLKAAAIK